MSQTEYHRDLQRRAVITLEKLAISEGNVPQFVRRGDDSVAIYLNDDIGDPWATVGPNGWVYMEES